MIPLNFVSARLFPVIGNIFGESFLVAALHGGDLLIPENKPSDEGLRGFMRAYAGLCELIGKINFFMKTRRKQGARISAMIDTLSQFRIVALQDTYELHPHIV